MIEFIIKELTDAAPLYAMILVAAIVAAYAWFIILNDRNQAKKNSKKRTLAPYL